MKDYLSQLGKTPAQHRRSKRLDELSNLINHSVAHDELSNIDNFIRTYIVPEGRPAQAYYEAVGFAKTLLNEILALPSQLAKKMTMPEETALLISNEILKMVLTATEDTCQRLRNESSLLNDLQRSAESFQHFGPDEIEAMRKERSKLMIEEQLDAAGSGKNGNTELN